ncbi:MAG: hypothetical protein LR015_00775 [Verrucomicrobia bacterium]|nr:hypothetical protein [Verrucomicrobiota bacterium]
MKKRSLITLTTLLLATASAYAQVDIFIARHTETESGLFNAGRVRSDALFVDTNLGQWNDRGNAGTVGDGTVWHAFARYKMFERDLFNKINQAGQITWTTGLLQKEKNRIIDAIEGGHDVDVYLVLDPEGQFVPGGQTPSVQRSWDWANELGLGYEHTVLIGRIPQTEVPSTAEERNVDGVIEVDSPAMRIHFDLTEHLKNWISEGLLTEQSTIAIGLVQRQAQIADNGQPKFDDPNLYIHSMMVMEVRNAFITTAPGDEPIMGPGFFSDYEVVDGWVDTGNWLGWVYVEFYPWAYVLNVSNFFYFSEAEGWVYVIRP